MTDHDTTQNFEMAVSAFLQAHPNSHQENFNLLKELHDSPAAQPELKAFILQKAANVIDDTIAHNRDDVALSMNQWYLKQAVGKEDVVQAGLKRQDILIDHALGEADHKVALRLLLITFDSVKQDNPSYMAGVWKFTDIAACALEMKDEEAAYDIIEIQHSKCPSRNTHDRIKIANALSEPIALGVAKNRSQWSLMKISEQLERLQENTPDYIGAALYATFPIKKLLASGDYHRSEIWIEQLYQHLPKTEPYLSLSINWMDTAIQKAEENSDDAQALKMLAVQKRMVPQDQAEWEEKYNAVNLAIEKYNEKMYDTEQAKKKPEALVNILDRFTANFPVSGQGTDNAPRYKL